MALWEYKVITSGKGGFATPALLESFLNQLGTEEWEIIEFRTQPDNPLAFHGLARRPTQRDWTLEAAAAAAARAEADKLRAEFAAKFQAATGSGSDVASGDSGSANPNRDDSFRRPRDTEYDQDPYALDDSAEDEADVIPEEDQLPTFFEAIRPHMRRNQKGPGHSVGLEFLIKKFDLIEEDILKAMTECGFSIPEDEDDKPTYVEYDGDLYWLNVNRRGEIWINTREKPRQVFRVAKGTVYAAPAPRSEEAPASPSAERSVVEAAASAEAVQAPETQDTVGENAAGTVTPRASSSEGAAPQEQGAVQPLPEGTALLDRLRKLMRRSRGGWSGTISYMARALRRSDSDLVSALALLGLVPPASQNEKAPVVEVGELAYWLNKDGRGGIWVNVREARRMRKEMQPDSGAAPAASGEGSSVAPESIMAVVEGSAVSVTAEEGQPEPTPQEKAAALAAVFAEVNSSQSAQVQGTLSEESPVVAVASASVPEVVAAPVSEVVAEPASVSVQENAPISPVDSVDAPKEEQPAAAPVIEQVAPTATPTPVVDAAPAAVFCPFAAARPHMKEGRQGNYSVEICILAETVGRPVEPFVELFVAAGLKVPEKPREKPVYAMNAGDMFWFTRNMKGELWLNARPGNDTEESKDEEVDEEAESPSEGATEEKKARRPRRRTRGAE